MELLIAGLALGSGLAILGFLMREAGLSKRVSLPLWLADAGLALMGAAVATWLLTAATVSADLSESAGAAVIAIGAVTVSVIGMILAQRASSVRRAVASKSAMRTAARTTEITPLRAVDTSSAGAQKDQLAGVPETTLHPEVRATDSPDAIVEPGPKRDWEAIWRETWGSGRSGTEEDSPESERPTADDDESRLNLTDSEPVDPSDDSHRANGSASSPGDGEHDAESSAALNTGDTRTDP